MMVSQLNSSSFVFHGFLLGGGGGGGGEHGKRTCEEKVVETASVQDNELQPSKLSISYLEDLTVHWIVKIKHVYERCRVC